MHNLVITKVMPFVTPIWSFHIGDSLKNEIETCYRIEKETPSEIKSNVGGYQSGNVCLRTHFLSLTKKLSPSLEKIAEDVGMSFDVSNAWININRKNNFNKLHLHPHCAFSVIVYLKTNDNSGKITFYNPAAVDSFLIDDTLNHFYGTYSFIPKVGDVLVFPAYLKHFVEPNLSDEDRISIAFNMK